MWQRVLLCIGAMITSCAPETGDSGGDAESGTLRITQFTSNELVFGSIFVHVREDADLCFDWSGLAAADPTWATVDEVAVLDPCSGGTLEEILVDELPDEPADFMAASFDGSVPLVAEEGTLPRLDWSGLDADGLGQPIAEGQVRTLGLARYDASLEALISGFPGSLVAPERRFDAEVAWLGSADSRACKDEEAVQFDGFTREGTWLVTLEEDACPPLAVAVVEIEEGGR